MCLVAAFAVVGIVGLAAWHKGTVVGLFFEGCDSVCYSLMEESLREARTSGQPVNYFLHDDQTEFLLGKFKATDLPEADWREAVGPHGFHYFRVTGQEGPQYPPGAPWELSFFRPDRAIHDLNRVIIWLIALTGLAVAGWCFHRRLVFSVLVAAMATYTCLAVLTWLDLASFSINATLFPLFAGIILAWFARERARGALAVLLAFAGGMGVGQAMEDRMGSVLLLPSMMLFFLPRRWGLMAAHVAGIVLCGVAPVLLHNKLVAGGYFLPTYDTGDTEQSLRSIGTNILFYIHWWYQNSCVHVFVLTVALLVLVAWIRSTPRIAEGHWRTWMWDHAGFILTPVSALAIAAAYFLTHVVREGYYLTPSMLTVATTLALLFVSLEIEWRAVALADSTRAGRCWMAIALAFAAPVAAYFSNQGDFNDGVNDLLHPRAEQVIRFNLPEEMQAPDAWIWADYYSGTTRLYTGHPAFKLYAASPRGRRLMYEWVRQRGEPQYIIEDSDSMRRILDEVRSLGWKTLLVGYAWDKPCYRLTKLP